MNDLDLRLEQLGDALEAAAARDLAKAERKPLRRWRSSRRRTLAVAATVVLLGATGAGIGASLLKSPGQEEQGLLDAEATFAGTKPQCNQVSAQQFHCLLASTPTGLMVQGSYRDTKIASVDAARRIDGGCVAVSDDGRTWECYLGDLAVRHGAIDQALLGQSRTSPAHG